MIPEYLRGVLILKQQLPQNHCRPQTSIFLKILKKDPPTIKAIGVPTPTARKLIYFIDYGDKYEDWHGYESDGAKGDFLDGITDKVKDDLFDEYKNLLLSMEGEGCDHDDEIGKFVPLSELKI